MEALHDASVLACDGSADSLLFGFVSIGHGVFQELLLFFLPANLVSSVECSDLLLDGAELNLYLFDVAVVFG